MTPYPCSYCPLSFQSISERNLHERNYHRARYFASLQRRHEKQASVNIVKSKYEEYYGVSS